MNFDVPTIVAFLYPFLFALMIIEYLNAKHLYNPKEAGSSFIIAIVSTLIASFTKVAALAVFYVVFELTKDLRAALFGYESLGWAWWIWVIAMISDDFNFYWHHRLSHHIRLLWAAHIPHHNAETFNLTVSIRNGWFITLYKPIFWMWMPLLGFEPIMIATALLINAGYQFFLHSQLVPSLGWYEKIFNTPYIHVVHHSCNVEYMDKNHGGILIIWDKLFGTFQDVIPGLKPDFGVTKGPGTYNPIIANTHEFQNIWKDLKRSGKFSDKLKYIFYPPGWSHDNSSKTARQLQAEFRLAQAS
jgi:sterol desaturase/sphingolipid hydroxylase (fatty acid hydroxylase superfamily)